MWKGSEYASALLTLFSISRFFIVLSSNLHQWKVANDSVYIIVIEHYVKKYLIYNGKQCERL